FRQVSAVETERFLLSQLAKIAQNEGRDQFLGYAECKAIACKETSQKYSQNPLKINLNNF
ncbi:hypothetical protein, partial [Duncaniella muris]|uniref:hypothetical protein n=1 Tax=Duncaniella muris TaxID=2094150 RepID=UPI002608A8C6